MLNLKEQYEHPLWQKKRYQVYNRDGFACRVCNRDCLELTAQLHCHHLYYKRDTLIWEYDDDALVTLCKGCHETIHTELPKLAGIIAFKILAGDIDVTDFTERINHVTETVN